MSRPTSEKKEKCIKLRVSEELYEELSARGSNLSETIRGILKNQPINSVPQNTDRVIREDIYEDLSSMALFVGGSVERMLELFDEALNNGVLMYEGDEFHFVPQNYSIDELEEACSERGVPLQEAIDKTVKNLRSGK